MKRALHIVVLLALAAPAAAQEIYKCVAGEGVGYQSTPCGSGQAETRLHVGPVVSRVEVQVAAAPAPKQLAPATRRPLPWRNQALVLGISDDEVLNMPAWGRPAKIARQRMAREWHEIWTYGSPVTGERQLRFVNARLADVVDAPAPQVAQLTLQ